MTLDYQNPMHAQKRSAKPWWTSIIWAAGVIIVLLLLIAILLPSMGRARETANRVKCASNLRLIGQASLIYANDHNGQLPPDLSAILQTQDINAAVFICPSADTHISKATGPTTQQVVTSLLSGDHLSYAWTGAGLTIHAPSDAILAFDLDRHVPKEGATGIGLNVLTNDGAVTFVDEPTAKAVWAHYVSGVRPIRLSACTTPAAPPVSSP